MDCDRPAGLSQLVALFSQIADILTQRPKLRKTVMHAVPVSDETRDTPRHLPHSSGLPSTLYSCVPRLLCAAMLVAVLQSGLMDRIVIQSLQPQTTPALVTSLPHTSRHVLPHPACPMGMLPQSRPSSRSSRDARPAVLEMDQLDC